MSTSPQWGEVAPKRAGEGDQTVQICEVGSPSPASHLRCSAPSPHWGEGKNMRMRSVPRNAGAGALAPRQRGR